MTIDWVKLLKGSDIYRDALIHVAESPAWRHTPEARQQEGCTITTMRFAERRLCRAIAKDITAGAYNFSPGQAIRIVTHEKERTVYQFKPVDRIVHLAVTAILNMFTAKTLVPNVYSYRDGYSYVGAVQALAKYVRDYRKKVPDPKKRGLYLVRTDISAYFDSIPVCDDAPVWQWLKDLLGPNEVAAHPELWTIFRESVRPVIIDITGREGRMEQGIPTGSPVANAVANLYLSHLDAALAAIPDAFYARYGDDIIFISPQEELTQNAIATIAKGLNELGLSLNEKKQLSIYFNGAGRSGDSPVFVGANRVEFLGFSVDFHGTVMLRPKRMGMLYAAANERLLHIVKMYRREKPTPDELGKTLARHLNSMLNSTCQHSHPYADALKRIVTDRSQLKQLDYRFTRLLIKLATGSGSPAMMRKYPPRHVREVWGYRSLVVLRNRAGRRKN